MHIVFIGFVWPEPDSSAAGQNILSYILACKEENWKVSFLSAADQNQYSAKLSDMGVMSYVTKLNCSSFNSQIMQLQPDIVIFDRFLTFEQFAWRVTQECPKALLVIDAEDLHFLRKARQMLVNSTQTEKLGKVNQFVDIFEDNGDMIQPELLYNDLCLREMACIFKADLTIVLSSFESQVLKRIFKVNPRQLSHIPFILSNKALDEEPLAFESKQDFVFIGNFRHAPNLHAAKLLAKTLWPQIRKKLISTFGDSAKQVKCNIYGSYMTPEAKQLHSPKDKFYMHGHADSQFEVINNARVMLAPITFGAGVKGKLIDAMRVNTPSVTTVIGAEGISNLPYAGVIANSANEFVEAAVKTYLDPKHYAQLVANGLQILKVDYDINTNKQTFIDSLKRAKAQQDNNKQRNFMQKLLHQQQFQANKYMSQWIEVKNKLLE